MLTKIRLTKILRYGLIFFIACVIVLSGLAAWGYFFLSPLVKQRLEEVVVTQSDSLYKLQIEKLKINLLSGKIWLENVYFEPKETQWKRKFKQKNPPPFAKVYVKAIEVREWSWWAYYWHQKLQINQIIVQKADVFYQKSNQSPKDENRKPIFDEKIIEKIAKVWEINDILIEKTDVSFKIFKKDYVWTHTAKNLRLNTQKVAFNAKKWQIKGFKGGFTRYTAHTPQGDYIYHAENLGVSSFDSTLTLTYFKIIPQENPENSIKFGFKQLKLTGIQYFEVLEQQKIAFNTLKCKEVEGFFSKIPDFLAKKPTQNQPKNPNPTNDSIKKYSFLHNIPFVIAWDKIEGEKINIYVGNTPENTQNQRKINENLHFYHAKNLRFSVDKGRLDKEKSIFPKNIDLNIADLAFQKANQKAKGENLHFSLKNKSFLLENILFSNDDHTKKVQFATEKLHIKGFPTFEQMQKDIQQTKALRFGYVGITKTDINWVSDMVFGGNKSGNLLQTLPNMQVDTLYVAQFGGNISPFAHIKAKINKAEAHLYQLRKENGAFSIQNAEVKGENLCFRNQKTGDTLSAKIFQLKKNPATLMLEDWEMNVALKGMQITPTTENNTKKNSQILHIQGQKNIIQIKNLDDFISQKKYHFAYIYTKNTKFDFVLKENKDFNKKQNENITNETVTNENTILDANLNNIKPFSLPAPIEIDSLVVEKNKVSFQHLSPNNQPKSIQSCKEINAKMLKVQMEKQVSLYKLPTFHPKSTIEIQDYKGDFIDFGHQVMAKKLFFEYQHNHILVQDIQIQPYQENYTHFFQKNPNTNLFVHAKANFFLAKNFLREEKLPFTHQNKAFFADFMEAKDVNVTLFVKNNALNKNKTNPKTETNPKNEIKAKNETQNTFLNLENLPKMGLDTLKMTNFALKLHLLDENNKSIKQQLQTRLHLDILDIKTENLADVNGFLRLEDSEFQSKELCVKNVSLDYDLGKKMVLFQDFFAENYPENADKFSLFAKKNQIKGLDFTTIFSNPKNQPKSSQKSLLEVEKVEFSGGFFSFKSNQKIAKNEEKDNKNAKNQQKDSINIKENKFITFIKNLQKSANNSPKIDTFLVKNMLFSFQKEHENGKSEPFLNEQKMSLDKIALFQVHFDTLSQDIKADNVDFVVKGYESNMDFGLYKSKINQMQGNSIEKSFVLENVSVNPIFSPEMVAYHRGKQADIWETAFEKVEVKGWDWGFLQQKQGLKADAVSIFGANYMMYKDKRRALPDKPATMLNERWRKITFPLQIDTLIAQKNAFFYTEFAPKAGTETGHIYFSDISAKIFPLKNTYKNDGLDTNQRTKAILDAKLMGEGQIELYLEIPLNQKNFIVSSKGRLGKMEATIFNMFLENTQHIRIKKGHIKEIRFDMEIQDTYAKGSLYASYKRLYVQVLGKKNIEKKRRFISFLANLIIKNRNNAERKHAKVGKIDYKKQPYEGFGLFFGKSIGTGIKDTLK